MQENQGLEEMIILKVKCHKYLYLHAIIYIIVDMQ